MNTVKFKRYLVICKPGIIIGNLITLVGGFLLAARGDVDLQLLLATAVGLSLVVASGCTLNNCIDRDIDGHMARTRNRVLVTGEISLKAALAHGVVLGVIGFALLGYLTNWLAFGFAAFGYVIYVGFYSLWLKRSSVFGTLVGSLSGAMPPVVGYCAASGQFDAGGAILLLIFCIWQMPHSYAIALFRLEDYRNAGIPVLPVKQGIASTKVHIVLYVVAFAAAALSLALAGFAGVGYLLTAVLVSIWWLLLAVSGYRDNIDTTRWARQMFAFSIIAISALSVMMSIDAPTSSLVASLF